MTKKIDQRSLPFLHRPAAITLTWLTAFAPTISAAAPPLPAPASTTLPQLRSVRPGVNGNAGATVATDSSRNQLTVTQNQGQANVSIDWNSFNVGSAASVRFYQGTGTPGTGDWKPNQNYTALNRIYDQNPSQIYGNLKADGSVYLINRNGILFGPGSRVDVHALAASALDMVEDDIQKGLLRFTTFRNTTQTQAGPISDDVSIANYGMITTDSGGGVYMVGPNVTNAGTIDAPVGRVKMVGVRDGGTNVSSDDRDRRFDVNLTKTAEENDLYYNNQALFGLVTNDEAGKVLAESGRVELAGGTVRQNGLIRAVSAVRQGGAILLTARDLAATGPKSVTESPVSDSSEKADQSFTYTGGAITFSGPRTRPDGSTSTATVVPLARIEHTGAISAPSGQVTLNATERVFLDKGSSIDVGGLWVDQPAAANLMEVQLNSVELRDDYGQKNGALKGEKIRLDAQTGSSIGNLSGSYIASSKSAMERSTRGGTISIGDSDAQRVLGELVVKEGASLNFGGGGFRTAAGAIIETMLLSGNQLYSLSNAPQWLNYRLVGTQKKVYQRFGITETFEGLYNGGGSAVGHYVAARTTGSDAGALNLLARQMVLDGDLNGSATIGQYQTVITPHSSTLSTDPTYQAYQVSVARGLERPVGGTLQLGINQGTDVGNSTALKDDSVVGDVLIKPTTTQLSAGFTATDPINRQGTELSATLLSKAGLGNLEIFSNTSVVTEKGAEISLMPGGSFIARGRRIEHMGAIDVPGGSVELTIRPNVTSYSTYLGMTGTENPLFRPLVETIYLAPGSRVSVAGETIDNTLPGAGGGVTGRLNGGSILIQDLTETGTSGFYADNRQGHRIEVTAGAELNVNGGYRIDPGNKVTGGDAGLLQLKAPTLSLAGEISGLSLPGKKGGEIRLHAGQIVIASNSLDLPAGLPIDGTTPENLQGKLVLGEHRLDQTGFSRISLTSIDDVTFGDTGVLSPSTAKLTMPAAAANHQQEVANISADYLGGSSLSLTAGINIYQGVDHQQGVFQPNNTFAQIMINAGSGLTSAPGGTVSLTAPIVDLAGTLSAPGGSVSVTADNGGGSGVLAVRRSGEILATGYNKQVTISVAGLSSAVQPMAGGTVNLSSKGDLVLETGSLVDVSGSAPVAQLTQNADGTVTRVVTASDPGSLKLSYGNSLTLDGTISGKARLAGLRGGSLEVRNSVTDLTVTEGDVSRYQTSGFDDLTFASSLGAIRLPAFLDVAVGRKLTLDAGAVLGTGSGEATLRAPWIRLVNSGENQAGSAGAMDTGSGRLNLAADSLDLEGSLLVSGFRDVSLSATRDIRLTDRTYTTSNNVWDGKLATSGNLTLQAGRIYPTTLTSFTVSTKGLATILPGHGVDNAPIYSAGGNLTITADQGIDHQGYLAAPMGSITLDAGKDGRVYLAEGSSTVAGGTVSVPYGTYDGSNWYDKYLTGDNTGSKVDTAPTGAISLKGNEVIVREGATLDLRGGGSVHTALFQPGIEGTNNPLTKSGRYVIVPDRSLTIPGEAVYLEAAPGLGLSAGLYSLLQADKYAFLPGALVVEATGTPLLPGDRTTLPQGYTMVAGYRTVTDTGVRPAQMTGFTIRRAEDVLKEGNFTIKQLTAGNGGDFTVAALDSANLSGRLRMDPLNGFHAGTIILSNPVIEVKQSTDTLPAGFDFSSPLPPYLQHTFPLDASLLADKGNLILGDADTTSLTVRSGAVLRAPSISLNAPGRNANGQSVPGEIAVESGAQVLALGSESSSGIVAINRGYGQEGTLTANNGTFTVADNALVRAANGIRLNVKDANLRGDLRADHSSFSAAADSISFVADGQSAAGLAFTESLWQEFSRYDDLTLISRGDMSFQFGKDATLTAAGNLTLDARRFYGTDSVALTAAGSLTLLNSGSSVTAAPAAVSGRLTLGAEQIAIAPNTKSIVFDGFAGVALVSAHDLLLQGGGTLKSAGDLSLTAGRVTTTSYRDPGVQNAPYQAASFSIESAGAVFVARGSGSAGTTITPGGTLSIKGRSIADAGVIEVPAGQVLLTATGSGADDGISLTGSAEVRATGTRQETAASTPQVRDYAYYPGGQIVLRSDSGAISLGSGTKLDVSAADHGTDLQYGTDAGSISLIAPVKGVTMAGTLVGAANATGKGGSFTLDAANVDISSLSATLRDGGFNNRIDIRARSGNPLLAAGDSITAREVVMAADGLTRDGSGNWVKDAAAGNLTVAGTITAVDGTGGGRVELNARNDLTVTGSILANGTTAGGEVLLGSESGRVTLQNGLLDVSGGSGGSVYLRALRNGANDVKMGLTGEVRGASQVVAEAFTVYQKPANYSITAADITTWLGDATSYMNAATAANLKGDLFAGLATGAAHLHLRPGIEVQGSGNLTLPSTIKAGTTTASTWDLSTTRYNGEPGVLTLRAAGNLTISADLVDHPTPYGTLTSATMLPSWGISLAGGADLNGAGPLAVNLYTPAMTGGDLTIGSGKVVYTENAPIRFAAARNVSLTTGRAAGLMINTTMTYDLGSYGGSIRGMAGNNLSITGGGAIQTALGDIDLRVGGNLDLGTNSLGAIRTTGEYPVNGEAIELAPGTGIFDQPEISDYWVYHRGGSITLGVDGSLTGNLTGTNEWDAAYLGDKNTYIDADGTQQKFFTDSKLVQGANRYLAASFGKGTLGIATMGGGDISVRTGGSFTAPAGAFGTTYTDAPGDLRIVAGGDLKGRFRVMNGEATLTSGGGFGASDSWQVMELAAARANVLAQGDAHLGAVLNPDNTWQLAGSVANTLFAGGGKYKWNMTYTPESAVAIDSLAGSLTYYGKSATSGTNSYTNYLPANINAIQFGKRQRIFPATVTLLAATDLVFKEGLALAPAATGNLTLVAGGDIVAPAKADNANFALVMADVSTGGSYGFHSSMLEAKLSDGVGHDVSVHAGDTAPVVVRAGGDITDLRLLVGKPAEIAAGRDIVRLDFIGQNTGATDLTSITAGRDLLLDITPFNLNSDDPRDQFNGRFPGIVLGGPGTMLIQAGDGLDLGNSRGIRAVGNSLNSSLTGGDSRIMVLTGAQETGLSPAAMVPVLKGFFLGKDGMSEQDRTAVENFFPETDGLLQAGNDYSALKSSGDAAGAAIRLAKARQGIVSRLFAEPSVTQGEGGIAMVDSQISGGSGDVYVLARSAIDVGRSAIGSGSGTAATGITTSGGGGVYVFAGSDINVNESRIMTYMGGDIAIWSDRGNVNAGRGSRTAMSAQPPKPKVDANGVVIGTTFVPPAAGSGVRAVTFDPDGLEGSLQAPEPGNISMFAPNGNIDAGEAGIVGGKITLAATEVLNSKNISASAGSVGVPAASEGSVSIGALSGAGNVTDSSRMIEQTTAGAAKDKTVRTGTQAVDDFMSKFLDIRVINFDTDADSGDREKDKDKEK